MSSGFLLLMVGIIGIFIPAKWMTFGERWKYKTKVEPSEGYVLMNRVGGVIIFIIGIFYIINNRL